MSIENGIETVTPITNAEVNRILHEAHRLRSQAIMVLLLRLGRALARPFRDPPVASVSIKINDTVGF